MALRRQTWLAGMVLAGLALLGSAPRAQAWNSTGHMVIASIAYDHLTPTAKARVDALLTADRDYAFWMSELPAGDTDKARFAFMKAATWPDDVRTTPDARPAWHYIDLPVIAPGYVPDSAAIAVPTPNAATQIPVETALLTQAGTSVADRAVALCWVEHLIGDIHQPLHGATFFSPMFPHGDKGGNDETLAADAVANDPLEASAHPLRLHALWDDILGQDTDPAYIAAVAQSLETPSYAPETFPQLTQDTTIPSWAAETNALAQEVVYIGGSLPMTSQPGKDAAHPLVTVTLPLGYISVARAVSNRQIALAGLRLANTLNEAFGG